ncbi:MAG: hypothetical protein FJX74_24455, partial [Armatimonadetes bacterium]|nr:hypothetical protein [Armatimonadota bacterium]
MICLVCLLMVARLLALAASPAAIGPPHADPVDASALRGKVMTGYQGWFRCPGDAAGMGWMHWSRDSARIAPETLTFEMWPDVSDYAPDTLCVAPGFTHPDGRQAHLFTSDSATTVLRHFEWMREHSLDGAWVQRFVVGLPGGPADAWYDSTLRVLGHVRGAATATGRVWALSYDTAAMPPEGIYEAIVADWQRLVDGGVVADARYLREDGRPVVQVWGFYPGNEHNRITAETGHRLVDYFAAPGPYQAFLVGGGTWAWRTEPGPEWQRLFHRFGAYCPWNIGNYSLDEERVAHASMHTWEDDRRECEAHGVLWLPTVYPGFSWDNLTRQPPGSSNIPRRGGAFLWEQF